MQDRNVQWPNRYQLTKVPGTDDIYDLTPAPGTITAEGTLINKDTLLKDATAALFGLDNTAVPDEVLEKLSGAVIESDGSLTNINGGSILSIETGSYTGSGSRTVSLSFNKAPLILFINGRGYYSGDYTIGLIKNGNGSMISGYTGGGSYPFAEIKSTTWSNNTVTFRGSNIGSGMNIQNYTYHYFAICK